MAALVCTAQSSRSTFFVCTALFVAVPLAAGHSFLAEPPSRNVLANRQGKEYCPHCLQAGGPNTVSSRGAGAWPTRTAPTSHGLCGDPVQGLSVATNWRDETYLVSGPVQRTYTAGQVVELQIGVSTHHKGHYEFRICDKGLDGKTLASREEGQACLDTWVLQRAALRESCVPNDPDPDCQPIDKDHPERWYLPPPGLTTQQVGPNWQNLSATTLPAMSEVHKMRYVIPAGLNCSRCTLQWYWSTGNTCLYDSGYFTYFERMKAAGWPAVQDWCNFCTPGATCSNTCCGPASGKYAEEFWNCADIAVLPSSGQQPSPSPASTFAPTPAPVSIQTTMPAPSPSTAQTTTTSLSATSTSSPCAPLWGQCGGKTWSGAMCCQAGSSCQAQSEWYSQCVPSLTPAPSPSSSTTAPSTTTLAQTTTTATTVVASANSTCKCSRSTTWDGSLGQFAGTTGFCSQNFGGSGPYISAGGGDGTSGGWSGLGPCSSGQYLFSKEAGWQITVDKSQAEGKAPYRAFAYLQFCGGNAYRTCLLQDTVTLSFSFRSQGINSLAAYVKLLFWTDVGNILGLVPPSHPKGNGQFRLVAFPKDDYPNSWSGEAVLASDSQYHVQVVFALASQSVRVLLGGVELSRATVPVNMLDATSGPQIGVYSFDYAGKSWSQSAFKVWLNDMCLGLASGLCPSGGADAVPVPIPSPATPQWTCAKMCGMTSGSQCSVFSNEGDCGKHFVNKGSAAIPCSWTPCGCIADAEKLIDCPNLSAECSAVLLQKGRTRGRPSRSVFLAPMLLEMTRKVQRTGVPTAESFTTEDGFNHAEL